MTQSQSKCQKYRIVINGGLVLEIFSAQQKLSKQVRAVSIQGSIMSLCSIKSHFNSSDRPD